MILYCISGSRSFIYLNKTKNSGTRKTSGSDYIRNMFLLQPLQPGIGNAVIYLYRYIVNDTNIFPFFELFIITVVGGAISKHTNLISSYPL
jgi:hypothetical protein